MIATGTVRRHHPSCPGRSGGLGCICPASDGDAQLERMKRRNAATQPTPRSAA